MIGDKFDIIIKCFTLLLREKELSDKNELQKNEISIGLVKNILDILSTDKKPLTGGDTIVMENLKNLLTDVIIKVDDYDRENLIQTLEVILREKEQIFSIIEKSLTAEMTVAGSKNSIASLRKYLYKYYKESEMVNLVSKASYVLNTSKTEEGVSSYISKLIDKLQALNVQTTTKDPAIQELVDVDDTNGLERDMEEMYKNELGGEKFISAWKGLNKMTNGGFRRGEQWVVGSLQHNYKSGFVRSLFVQLITRNKPINTKPGKKPLALFISFEDQTLIINSFIYKYLYHNEFKEEPDLSKVTSKDISEYVSKKLSANGFKVLILKVDPSMWTYQNVMNKVIELEADGYDCQIMVIDYLSKLSTAGCRFGPNGTEYRDLFDKMRQFAIGHNILFFTPHQLSTEAKGLAKAGLRGYEFIREIANKGYYSDTRQLDQVVDGEIYIIKTAVARNDYKLFVGRGKHRSTKIISNDNDLEFSLQFPKNGMPILEDIDEPDTDEITGVGDFFL